MTSSTEKSPTPAPFRPIGPLIAIAIVAIGVIAALYGTHRGTGNAIAASCQPAVARAAAMEPLARGEVAAVSVPKKPALLRDLTFRDGDGKPVKLSEMRGKTTLLNLWATWCVPCRREMPALNALQAKLGGDDFQVVAVNIDTNDPEKPKAWLKENRIDHLAYFADPTADIFQDLKSVGKAFGMPTTLILDPKGCEIGYLAGPAEWASEDALALVRAAIGRS